MYCVTDNGHELQGCPSECPLRAKIKSQEQLILKHLPERYAGLLRVLENPEELALMLAHLNYYGCITRDSAGYYSPVRPLPTETVCPFLLYEE